MPSVLLIDSSPIYRGGVRKALEAASFTIAAEVATVSDAAASTRRKVRPDLVLLTLHQSAAQLSEAIPLLRTIYHGARIVVLGSDPDLRHLTDALRAGVDGFLFSDISKTALVHSLDLVLTGERVLPGSLAGMLVTEYGDRTAEPESSADLGTLASIANLEIRILRCLINGLSNKLIAKKLDMDEETVKAQIRMIFRKTYTKNRTQAAIWAVNHSLELRTVDRGRAPERRSTASRLRG